MISITTSRHACAVAGCLGLVCLVPPPCPAQPPAEAIAPPAAAGGSPQEIGYTLGYRIGERIRADHESLGVPLDYAAMARGLGDAVGGGKPRLDEETMKRVMAGFEAAMQQRQQAFERRMKAAGQANLAKGAEFLKTNAARKGVVSLASGLQYEVLKEGTGPQPTLDDVVVAHYRGTHIDGSEFDATDPQGEPATFPLRGVVPGWQEALPRMKAGSKWRIYLPPALGYGEEGSPPAIEPNEVLVFDIELLGTRPAGRQ